MVGILILFIVMINHNKCTYYLFHLTFKVLQMTRIFLRLALSLKLCNYVYKVTFYIGSEVKCLETFFGWLGFSPRRLEMSWRCLICLETRAPKTIITRRLEICLEMSQDILGCPKMCLKTFSICVTRHLDMSQDMSQDAYQDVLEMPRHL